MIQQALSSLLLVLLATQAVAGPITLPDRFTGSAPLDPAQYPYLDTKHFRDTYGIDLSYATFFDLRDYGTTGQYVTVGSAGGDVGRVQVGTVPQNHLCASSPDAAKHCFYSLDLNGLRSHITSRTEGILIQAVEVALPRSEGDIRYFNGNQEQVYIPITTTSGISYFGFKVDNMLNESFDDTLRFVVQSGNVFGQNGLNLTIATMERIEEVTLPPDVPPTNNVPISGSTALLAIGGLALAPFSLPAGALLLVTSGGTYLLKNSNSPRGKVAAPAPTRVRGKRLLPNPSIKY